MIQWGISLGSGPSNKATANLLGSWAFYITRPRLISLDRGPSNEAMTDLAGPWAF